MGVPEGVQSLFCSGRARINSPKESTSLQPLPSLDPSLTLTSSPSHSDLTQSQGHVLARAVALALCWAP